MPRAPNLLLLDDDPLDAILVKRTLDAQFPDLSLAHALTREEYLDRLASDAFDLVLADGSVAGCEGLTAFHLAREHQPRVPLIFISGFDDPSRDIRGLQALGVSDLLSKSDLPQLPAIIRHALHEQPAPQDAALLAGYERLVGVVTALSAARDLPTIMAIVRRAARKLTGADGATFVLRDGNQCHYADEDAIGPLWKGQKFPMESCISGWAMTHRQPAVVEDIFTDPRIPVSAYEPTFVRSIVMAPIRAMQPIGAIGSYWAERRLPERHQVQLLQALADTTAVAMENVRVHGELEARVVERTADLDAFTYAVSHDLRTPVRHMQGFASILLEDHGERLDGELKDGLERIAAAATRMAGMIDGLLELSRTARAPVRRLPVDLAALAREVAAECDAAGGRPVAFTAPQAMPVRGDPTLLRIALQNLLGNAWKFTGRSAAPQVALGAEEGADGETVYHVRDNGAGFDEASAGKLFGVFQRLHSQAEFPGTGVGLASVQRIVTKHGGRIWARSAPGEGATFYFTLGAGGGKA